MYNGQFIPYDDSYFDIFFEIGQSESFLRRLKLSNLKTRACLSDSPAV